ncbi:unnamed protein product [Cuscuta europaea]|uniref:Myb-like domain-containing protein n=1 Tax=Cuscuta europaea TaxID=41803 RepID=A0A9P1EC76_CUSEU|nr:unnamed protein product [Cuscuta europaea]
MAIKDDDATGMLKQSEMRSKNLKKNEENKISNGVEGLHFRHIENDEEVQRHNICVEGSVTLTREWAKDVEKKKKKRQRDVMCNVNESHPGSKEIKNTVIVGNEDDIHSTVTKLLENDISKEKLTTECNGGSIEMARIKKKKKIEKGKKNKDSCAGLKDTGTESLKTIENENIKRRNMAKNVSKDTKPQKNKTVQFADDLQVVHVFDVPEEGGAAKNKDVKLVQGKRFSKEEDEIIMKAVSKFIEKYDLGDEGLEMVLNCQAYPNLRHCWYEIATAIPYRPYKSIYYRARNILWKNDSPWTKEDYEFIRAYHEKHGNKWTAMAKELGKYSCHVFNAWMRTKLPNMKKGGWSQEEYKTLFDLVNMNLQLKVSEEKKSKHGMLRDNISWIAISEKLATRNNASCCSKWYRQLTSPLVAEGKWSDSDDYRMIGALYELDVSCIENVDWDNLLEHRPGEVCLQRWKQMVRYIGNYGTKPFSEQVELLAQRYCPYLLEAREAWDNKPYVA